MNKDTEAILLPAEVFTDINKNERKFHYQINISNAIYVKSIYYVICSFDFKNAPSKINYNSS